MNVGNDLDNAGALFYHVWQGGESVVISLRLSDTDKKFIKDYAALKGKSVSEIVRNAVLEKIEDEIDLIAYDRAMAEYLADPVTYTLDEVERMLSE
jgi:stalled ribosome rescue protein Dom34